MNLTESIAPKSDQIEHWLPVVGYEGAYEVSDLGNARSLARVDAQGASRRQRTLKPSRLDAWGHLGIKLRRQSFYVHRLVLEAFIGPCPPGMEGCHWNDIPDDNHLTNLRWATKSANRFDCVRNGSDHNARKKQCWRGHSFSSENTYIHAGRRHCRKCQRINEAAYRARRAETSSKGRAA